MTYATVQDLVDRFGEAELIQLTGRQGEPFEAVVEARAETALVDAGREIEAYLRPRYAVPVTTGAGLLVSAACDLARERLMLAAGHVPTETAKDAASRVRAWLRDVQAGNAQLDLPGTASTGDAPATGRVEVGDRTLSRESLAGW